MPGERVAASLPNDLPIVGLFLGAMRLGALWVGVNRQLAPPEKAYVLADCGATVLVGDADSIDELDRHRTASRDGTGTLRLLPVDPRPGSEWMSLLSSEAELPPPPDPLGPAAIAYTSGTTGYPKGVVHSQHNLMLPGAVLVESRGYGPGLRKADCFPLTILNLQVLSTLLVAQAQGTAIVMDRVDPVGIAEWVRTERATIFNGAPAMLYSLSTEAQVHADALSTLDEVWSGGSVCPAEIQERFTAKFSRSVTTTYGLTEAPSVITILPRGDTVHLGSSGRSLPHLTLRIVDGERRAAAPCTVGEICVSAATEGPWSGRYRTMLGYWEQPDATDAVLKDGWLHTGDLGHLDADGYLHVADRQSSLILRGGANVYPAEVERVIDGYPGVGASCVLGIHDERLGERVVAVVELAPGSEDLDLEDLRRHCTERLARYKVPERFTLGRLPRNSMGKVSRTEVAPSHRSPIGG